MLLLYGPCGSGKSTWARYVALDAGYTLSEYSPSSCGKHDTQKLDFFLRSQPPVDVRGNRLALLLDDVDELFAACPAAASIKTICPVIATSGATPSAWLRRGASRALLFSRIQPHDARKVVLRFQPQADARVVDDIIAQAHGDLRQLLLRASATTRCFAKGGTDASSTGFEVAHLALNGGGALPPLDDDLLKSGQLQMLIYENFHGACGDSQEALEAYAGFLSDACELSVIRSLEYLALAARCRRTRRSTRSLAQARLFLPESASREDGPSSEKAPDATGEAPDVGAYARRDWVSRKPRFKPGLHMAARLLQARLGDAGLATMAARGHATGDPLEDVYVSPGLRLPPEYVTDYLEAYEIK
jgi:hypothetical protein